MAIPGFAVRRVASIGFAAAFLAFAGVARPVEKSADRIPQLLEQLGSADPIDAEAAEILLTRLTPETFPRLQTIAAAGKLNPVVAERLKKFIERQLPYQAPRKRLHDERRALGTWRLKIALAAYERAGLKNPRWDADARSAIASFAGPVADYRAAHTAANKAIIAKNCRDPYVFYIEARAMESLHLDPGVIASQFRQASDRVTATGYPAVIKMLCYLGDNRVSGQGIGLAPAGAAAGRPVRELALEQWPVVLKDKVPQALLSSIADTFTHAESPLTRKQTFDAIYTPWQKADPDNVELLTYKGKFYADYAWDARGGDWANKVTEEGWRLFAERLTMAEQALTQAWEKDHNASDAAATMIKVELGQGKGRDRMEMWFKRAMDANPDNKFACGEKMLYLEPKWHGKPIDMIMFARECLAGQNWQASLPMQIELAYANLQAYVDNTEAFYGAPAVWNDIQSCYVAYLRAHPENVWVRNKYAHFACLAGKWDVAQQQFTLIGTGLYPERFGGKAAMQQFQTMARERGAAAPAP